MLIEKHNWNLRISGVSWKKVFAFETELYSKISVWKTLKCIWHSFQSFVFFIFISTQRGNDIPESLSVSLHSHKLLTEFNFIRFCQILKIIQSLVSLHNNISTFDGFFKKSVQILYVSVKLVITIEKNWIRVEHVQLFYN